ncbi:MAG: hypothetical protein HQK53_19800 [Oligoflexia bacterium]|nr:hypothetical protein [Oligoflexia bacterium]
MKLLLIGDSNLCHHAFRDENRAKVQLNVSEVEILRLTSRAAHSTAFGDAARFDTVLISSVLNHVADLEVKWKKPFDKSESMCADVAAVMNNLAADINKAAQECPNTKFIVVPPTIRTDPIWMYDYFDLFKKTYLDLLDPIVVKAKDPPIGDTDLRSDGVHMRDMPLSRYRQYIKESIEPETSWADEAYEAFENEDSPMDVAAPDKSNSDNSASIHQKLDKLLEAMGATSTKTESKFLEIDTKFSKTNYSLAKIKEDLDMEANSRRHNIVVIRRLPKPGDFIDDSSARLRAIKVKEIFEQKLATVPKITESEFRIRSIYLIPVPEIAGVFQDFRLVCADDKDAIEIRGRVIKARKEKMPGWEDVEVTNDPVKSTRVRIFLLQAIVRRLREMEVNKNIEILVSKFSDNPSIVFKSNGKVTNQIGFVESIQKHGKIVSSDEINKARRIAGRAYAGYLESYFIIVPEANVHHPLTGSNEVPVASGSGMMMSSAAGRGGVKRTWQTRGRGRGRGDGAKRKR